jgi:hypothetical protein
MRKLLTIALSLLVVSACASTSLLYAQTPATLKATWQPNPGSENVTAYKVTVDSLSPVTVPMSACTATECVQTFQVTAAGTHTVNVVAVNLALSSDPASTQDSAPLVVTFTLNSPASAPKGGKVTK